MSSTGQSAYLRRVMARDEACPAWFAALEPRPAGFLVTHELVGQFEGPEQAALEFVQRWTTRIGGFRVWVWRGILGERRTVRVLRQEDGSLIASLFQRDQ